jgi:flagellar assembly protein FliH
MLSRIIRREAPQPAELMTWPSLDQPEPPPPSREQAAAQGPQITPEQLADLQRRLAEMQSLKERAERDARQAGLREGEAAGRAKATAELQAVMQRLAAAIDQTATERARLRQASEGDLIKLAVAIAQRILHRQISVDPDAIGGIIRAAFEKLQRQEIFRVRAHPSHQQALLKLLPPDGARKVEIVGDPALPPGGIVFETAMGDLDASIETQLREIECGLADRLRKQQHG